MFFFFSVCFGFLCLSSLTSSTTAASNHSGRCFKFPEIVRNPVPAPRSDFLSSSSFPSSPLAQWECVRAQVRPGAIHALNRRNVMWERRLVFFSFFFLHRVQIEDIWTLICLHRNIKKHLLTHKETTLSLYILKTRYLTHLSLNPAHCLCIIRTV